MNLWAGSPSADTDTRILRRASEKEVPRSPFNAAFLSLQNATSLLVLIFELTLFFLFEFLILLSPAVSTVHDLRIKLYKTKVMLL